MVQSKNHRVLWILNHTTLMEWEVPTLLKLGFEVYVPKLLPEGPNSRTATVTTAYDASLSIPSEDLAYLNTVNFYESPLSPRACEIINKHFGNCIAASIYPGLYYLLRSFKGKIFMRAFGHGGDMDYERATTTVPEDTLDQSSQFSFGERLGRVFNKALNRCLNPAHIKHHNLIMDEMFNCRQRLYLAASYREIFDNESAFLSRRGVYLPLALPDSILRHTDTWRGGDPRLLFICPNIDQIDYYRRIYLRFKEELGSYPYCIAGRQDLNGVSDSERTDDPNILGYISRDALDRLLQTCACMFYHSQEPRHLHYHPLESIVAGQPLVFMSGGLLERLGKGQQAGMCASYAEAREKIGRLLGGDTELQTAILRDQVQILDQFRDEYCTKIWQENFVPIAIGEGK